MQHESAKKLSSRAKFFFEREFISAKRATTIAHHARLDDATMREDDEEDEEDEEDLATEVTEVAEKETNKTSAIFVFSSSRCEICGHCG